MKHYLRMIDESKDGRHCPRCGVGLVDSEGRAYMNAKAHTKKECDAIRRNSKTPRITDVIDGDIEDRNKRGRIW